MKKLFFVFFLIFLFIEFYGEEISLEPDSSLELDKSSELTSEVKSNTSFVGKSIITLDSSYLGTSLKNNGWGLGVNWEVQIFNFFALQSSFSHMSMWPTTSDVRIETVGIGLNARHYPFSRGLDWLYIGFGNGCDFFMYDGSDVSPDHLKDTVISIYPHLGWKQSFLNIVMIDIFCGYRVILNKDELASFAKDITKEGVQYGASLKLNLGKIFSRNYK